MKKTACILCAIALLLALCACGKAPAPSVSAPAPTEQSVTPAPADTPAPISTPAPVCALGAPYFVLVPMGEDYTADFDGDGENETVCVTLSPDEMDGSMAAICVDGAEMRSEHFEWPYESYWIAADIDTADERIEIAVQDYGPSNDYTVNFYRLEGDALRSLGSVEGMLWDEYSNGDVHFTGDGFVQSYLRLEVLQTWFAACEYTLDAEGMLAPVPQEIYYAGGGALVTAQSDLTAYSDVQEVQPWTLPAGMRFYIVGTDNVEWVECVEPEGPIFWLHLDEGGLDVETPEGYVFGGEAIDGLNFAD